MEQHNADDPLQRTKLKKKKKKKNKNKEKEKIKGKLEKGFQLLEPPPKKRTKKAKTSPPLDYDARLEAMMGQLRQMPGVVLLEPYIGTSYNVMLLHGSVNMHGEF